MASRITVPKLEERRQVIARCQQQPHGQDRGQANINDDEPGERQGPNSRTARAARLDSRASRRRAAPPATSATPEHRGLRAPDPVATTRECNPTMMAAGMVANTVELAHGLCFMTFTITRLKHGTTEITMMSRVPMRAAKPPKGPNSSRAICPRLRPLRRVEHEGSRHVLHAAAENRADENPQRAGQITEDCAASVGPTRGPAPAMAAK